jgi:putative transposase
MQQLSNFCNAYAKAFNKDQKRKGALFIDYVKRSELDTADYQKETIRYIHYNPVKHGFTDRVQDWAFSSFHSLISDKPTKLARDTVMEWFDGREAFLELHKFNDRNWSDNEWEFGMY